MIQQIKYLLAAVICLPLLPYLFYLGIRTKRRMPVLPNANNPTGVIGNSDKSLKVLFMGESTFAGVGVQDHSENVTGKTALYLSEKLKIKVVWESISESGYTARKVNKLLTPFLAGKAFDICIIGLGGNETFELNSPLRWKNDLKKLIFSIRSYNPNIPIVIANLPPVMYFPIFPPLMKLLMGELVKLHQVVILDLPDEIDNVYIMNKLIPLKEWVKTNNRKMEDFFSDGVHPSALSYGLWGEEIGAFVVNKKLDNSESYRY